MKGEKTPCIPSLVPVVQLAQPGKLFGRIVERNGALEPSFISRDKTGSLPALASGLMISNVAPSSPMMTVFILCLRGAVRQSAYFAVLCVFARNEGMRISDTSVRAKTQRTAKHAN